MVSVVAGVGAGKSTLLRQLADAVVVDCSLSEGGSLRDRVDRKFADRHDRWRILCLDDVQAIECGTPDHDFLTELIDGSSSAAPLVVASRVPLTGLTARRLAGDVLELGAADLAFSPDEAASLVERERADAYGNWPGLVALVGRLGERAADDYIGEVMAADLSPSDRDLLTAAALLGRSSRTTLSDVVGRTVTDRDLTALSLIPLVSLDTMQIDVHRAWRAPLLDLLDSDRRRELLAGAGRAIMDTEQERAIELLIEATDGRPDAANVVQLLGWLGYSGISSQVLDRWIAVSTRAGLEEHSAEGLLLRGLACRATDPLASEAVRLLGRAAEAFADHGCIDGEVLARSELGFAHRMRGESTEMVDALSQVQAVADGPAGPALSRPVRTRVRATAALLADEAGDDHAVLNQVGLAHREGLPGRPSGAISLLGMLAAFNVGDPERMVGHAEQYRRVAPPDRWWVHDLPAIVDWHCGRPFGVIESMPGYEQRRVGNVVDQVWVGATWATVAALHGRLAEARDLLMVAEAAHRPNMLPRLRSVLASGAAAFHAAEGDDEAAKEVINQHLDGTPEHAAAPVRAFHWALAVVYVLAPDLRAAIDQASLGPPLAAKREAGRAMVALREGRCPEPATHWLGAPEATAAALPVPWAAELSCALLERENPAGVVLVESLVRLHGPEVRRCWRAIGSSAAKSLIRVTPIDPGTIISLDLLGTTRLSAGGTETAHRHWARSRVRALLALLAHRGPLHREEAMAALWPDFDETSARNNLRVTLSHLQAVLEPDRERGDATFYLQVDDHMLTLAGEPNIVVDAVRFERLLDRADDLDDRTHRADVVSLLSEATELWRGDYLSDFRYEGWAQHPSDRLRTRYVGGLLRLVDCHLADGDYRQSLVLAERVLEVEPWSTDAVQCVIDAHVLSGDRASATRAEHRLRSMLDDFGLVEAG